jgi:hypothetical protein
MWLLKKAKSWVESLFNAANGIPQLDDDGHLVGPIILRTGTAVEINAITLEDGELAYCSDTEDVRKGDGATAGGTSLLGLQATTQAVSADDGTIAHNNCRWVFVSFPTTPGASFTFSANPSIADGTYDGQLLSIMIVAGFAGRRLTINNGTNCILQGNWNCGGIGGYIDLFWRDGDWHEIRRGLTGLYVGGSAPGEAALCIGGYNGLASGKRSAVIGGYEGEARHECETVIASNGMTNATRRQLSAYLLKLSYQVGASEGTTPTWHEMILPERWVLEGVTTVGFTITIIGRTHGNYHNGMFKRMAVLRKYDNSGTYVTYLEDVQVIGTDIKTDAEWDVQITADDANDSIKIEVHCADSDSNQYVEWVAYIEPLEIGE